MSDNKNKSTATVGRITGKGFLQGRIFSLEFFKRNWVYVVFVMAMALAYIGNKFACQSSIQELIALKTDLANGQCRLQLDDSRERDGQAHEVPQPGPDGAARPAL